MQHFLEEFTGARFLGALEHFGGSALFDDFSARTENHACSNVARKVHVVRHDNHRHLLFGKLEHHVLHFDDHLGVKCRGDFIEQHQLRLEHQGTRNGNPLLLAAGELTGVCVELAFKAEASQIHASALGRFCLMPPTFVGARIRLPSTDRCGNSV